MSLGLLSLSLSEVVTAAASPSPQRVWRCYFRCSYRVFVRWNSLGAIELSEEGGSFSTRVFQSFDLIAQSFLLLGCFDMVRWIFNPTRLHYNFLHSSARDRSVFTDRSPTSTKLQDLWIRRKIFFLPLQWSLILYFFVLFHPLSEENKISKMAVIFITAK